jgi:hypothetical protein
MVRWAAAAEAADAARSHPALGVGLHLDLGEWVCCNGEWSAAYEVVALDDREGLAEEVGAQLDMFRRLMGCDPTHLDSHQHVHLQRPLRGILARLAADLNVPLRSCAPHIPHCGSFYGQTVGGEPLPDLISVAGLLGILEDLPPGACELSCHPADLPARDPAMPSGAGRGCGDDFGSVYHAERAIELETLCHPAVRAALEPMAIRLCTFRELRSATVLPGTPRPSPRAVPSR